MFNNSAHISDFVFRFCAHYKNKNHQNLGDWRILTIVKDATFIQYIQVPPTSVGVFQRQNTCHGNYYSQCKIILQSEICLV